MATSFAFASLIVAAAVLGQSPLVPLGRWDRRLLPEVSGTVQSRRHPGIFWAHNDSGNPPEIFAVKRDGRIVGRFRLAVANLDWEAIAIDDQGHLYLGDIGNNTGLLRVRTIHRIAEPDPASNAGPDHPITPISSTAYALPAANRFDAEALFYDRGAAIVIAKYRDGREAELFQVALPPLPGPAPNAESTRGAVRAAPFRASPVTVKKVGRLPRFREPVTGADLSADGALLAVCSPAVTRVYRREGEGFDRLTPLAEVRFPPAAIEGIAWDGRDLVLAAEEGRGLFGLSEKTWRAAAVPR